MSGSPHHTFFHPIIYHLFAVKALPPGKTILHQCMDSEPVSETTWRENMKRMKTISMGLGLAMLLWVGSGLTPQVSYAEVDMHVWSAKILCGFQSGVGSNGEPDILPGLYRTVVNVHNPNFENHTVLKKAVIAFPERHQPTGGGVRSKISKVHSVFMKPDDAFSVSCKDILKLYPRNQRPKAAAFDTVFFEGFLVLYQPMNPGDRVEMLDVTTAYTALLCNGPLGTACTQTTPVFDVEAVRPRDVTGDPNQLFN